MVARRFGYSIAEMLEHGISMINAAVAFFSRLWAWR